MDTKLTTSRRSKLTASAVAVRLAGRKTDLGRAVDIWLTDGKSSWSQRTLTDRRHTMDRFLWWVQEESGVPAELGSLTPHLVRSFLAYTREPRQGGRYGSERQSAAREPRPATVNAYFRALRAFGNFLVLEGLLRETPLRNVKAPKVPKDQVEPYTEGQLQQLLNGARASRAPDRDVAVILTLVDSGMRVSELCGLTVGDAERGSGELKVTGKGNKVRTAFLGVTARRALWRYLENCRREATAEESLFTAEGGHQRGAGMTIWGIRLIVSRAGEAAGIKEVRNSPHTLRHTFAINFLRGGGDLVELQEIMGHEDLTTLKRYLKLVRADLAKAHRAASPADRMKLR